MTDASLAVLYHLAHWDSPGATFAVADDISLCRFEGSAVQSVYNALCADEGIDDGEPLSYGAFARFGSERGYKHLSNVEDPYSSVQRLSNLISIITAWPPTWSRLIWSHDDFRTSNGTLETHYGGIQLDFIQRGILVLTADSLRRIRTAWDNTSACWSAKQFRSRLINALVNYYYAWRSHYCDQMCLSLAVCLEVLFAPHDHAETAHQICYNLARFMNDDPSVRESHYDTTRDFYRVRSAIVHGGSPSEDKVIDAATRAFDLATGILARIVTDRDLVATFDNNQERRELLRKYMFS